MADAPPPPEIDVPQTEPAEPALSTGAIVSGGTLLVNGLVLFGVPITVDQKLYVVALITFLAPLVAGMLIRGKVWSPKTVSTMLDGVKETVDKHKAAAVSARNEAVATKAAAEQMQAAIPSVVQGLVSGLIAAPQEPAYAAQDPTGPQSGWDDSYEPYDEPPPPAQRPPRERPPVGRDYSYPNEDRNPPTRRVRQDPPPRERRNDRPDLPREPTRAPRGYGGSRHAHGG